MKSILILILVLTLPTHQFGGVLQKGGGGVKRCLLEEGKVIEAITV